MFLAKRHQNLPGSKVLHFDAYSHVIPSPVHIQHPPETTIYKGFAHIWDHLGGMSDSGFGIAEDWLCFVFD